MNVDNSPETKGLEAERTTTILGQEIPIFQRSMCWVPCFFRCFHDCFHDFSLTKSLEVVGPPNQTSTFFWSMVIVGTHMWVDCFGSRNSSPTNKPPGESSVIFDIHAKSPEFANSPPGFWGPVQIMGNLREPYPMPRFPQT